MNRPLSRLRLFAAIRQIRRWVRFGFGRERSAPEGGSPHRQRRLRSGAVLNQVTFAGMTELPSVRDAPSLTDANTRSARWVDHVACDAPIKQRPPPLGYCLTTWLRASGASNNRLIDMSRYRWWPRKCDPLQQAETVSGLGEIGSLR